MDVPPVAAVADACLRLNLPVRVGPAGLRPTMPGLRLRGPAVPARHCGSVDVFLEAMRDAPKGAILVVDNNGRLDEGCVGDLTAAEVRGRAGIAMAVWGCHRDTLDLHRMKFPVWSLGTMPAGPQRLDARPTDALTDARFGLRIVKPGDWAYADDDGIIFIADKHRKDIEAAAHDIVHKERKQATAAEHGILVSKQLGFDAYLAARKETPQLTFREHLRKKGGAIEE
jgi:regulator of RNase E activity RraA